MKKKVWIFDTTLRDGEQSPGASLNPLQKLQIGKQLVKLGVDIIEAGFPISSPGDFQAVSLLSKELKNVTVCGLTRAIQKDIEVAAEALKKAEKPRIHTGVGASDIHIKYKFRTDREGMMEMAVQAVKSAKKYVEDVEFYAEDAGRSEPAFLYRMLEAAIKAGATVVNIPDTTGYTYPEEWGALIKGVVENVPNIHKAVISVHCHNDLGMATANALAGLNNGARQVECTINGIGERAGNTSLEEVVMALESRKNYFGLDTGINTKEIYKTSRLVSNLTGIPVQPNKAVVGANAFAHSSGIHQAGVLEKRETYEIMDPKSVGVPQSKIILTARSGRNALRYRLKKLGYDFGKDKLEEVYEKFLETADKKKYVFDEDLEAIATSQMEIKKEGYELESFSVNSGTGITPLAVVRLTKNGENFEEKASGDGPVDACFIAIDKITGISSKMESFSIGAVTGGTEALGETNLQLKIKRELFSGRGLSTDIIESSIKAYLSAINKYLQQCKTKELKKAGK